MTDRILFLVNRISKEGTDIATYLPACIGVPKECIPVFDVLVNVCKRKHLFGATQDGLANELCIAMGGFDIFR